MENSPRYQKVLQKFMRMNPQQRAIFDAGLVHAQFADENMRRQIQGIRDAALNLERSQNVGMGKERLGLAKDRVAADLDLRTRRQLLGRDADAASLGLREREYEIGDRDSRRAEILGLGSTVLDTVQGYQNMQNKIALAKKYKGLAPLIYKGL